MKAQITAIGILLACSAPALAGHAYRWVGNSGDNNYVFVDTSSIQRHGDKVTVWILAVQSPPVRRYEDNPTSPLMRYELFQNEYDCATRHEETLYNAFYGMGGTLISSGPGEHEGSPVIPDSIGDSELAAACHPGGEARTIFESVDAAVSFADSAAKESKRRR